MFKFLPYHYFFFHLNFFCFFFFFFKDVVVDIFSISFSGKEWVEGGRRHARTGLHHGLCWAPNSGGWCRLKNAGHRLQLLKLLLLWWA